MQETSEQESSEQDSEKQEQEILFVEVLVKGADGQPVVDATVTPWALRCSAGHGLWSAKSVGGVEPIPVITDSNGIAKVAYPKFAILDERVSTTTVSVSVDHSDHPYVASEHINVPREDTHQFQLPAGVALEIKALVDGEVDTSEQVHIVSNPGRPRGSTVTVDGVIQIQPMAEGPGQLLLVRMDGEKPTHFSSIINLDIEPEQGVLKKEIELRPAVSVQGRLSDNVSRPVKNGRVKVLNIRPGVSRNEIAWTTWAEVKADGTFIIESWPAEEPIQLVALCDGFCAESGEKPPMVTPERARGAYLRAQVFMKPIDSEIVVQMTPMVDCHFEIKDAFGKPVSDVIVAANPNIGWWNGGSQIYCFPLARSAEWLATGKYEPDSKEGLFAIPFVGNSDEQGQTLLQLPAGRRSLVAYNEKYQLPINVGRRSERVEVEAGDSMDITLVVQPKGLEVLGDWEDLCGLVFG
ncbi:MAG: Ig-like domain-containing protein [Pirellulaceae bacterium]